METNAAIDKAKEKPLKDNTKPAPTHETYYGVEFTNILPKQKAGVSMCTENFLKDRNSSDMVESLNLALGATNELRMLLFGVNHASALFATMLSARTAFLKEQYETVASIML